VNFLKTLVAAGLVAASTVPVRALDISGAGATFPYPIYAKWADAYKKETGSGMNYQSIGSGGGIKDSFSSPPSLVATCLWSISMA
jgi:phosphate transport system substrate-binding protein